MFQNVHYAFNVKIYTVQNNYHFSLTNFWYSTCPCLCYQNKFKTNAIHTLKKAFFSVLFIMESYLASNISFDYTVHTVHMILTLKFANQLKQAAYRTYSICY